MTEEDTQKFALCLERLARRRRLDWTKVQSVADVICVLSTLLGDASVDPESAAAKKLERFLEPTRRPECFWQTLRGPPSMNRKLFSPSTSECARA